MGREHLLEDSGEGSHIVCGREHSRQCNPRHPDQLDQRGDKREREGGDTGPRIEYRGAQASDVCSQRKGKGCL